MCGIYGTTIKYNDHQITDKLKRTVFRGPDHSGYDTYSSEDQKVTFGFNRLSIIDLDARSNQPFTYQKSIHIVFNGEIYNFRSIRKELSTQGYQFNTTSDTEVVCAAYLAYGEECIHHFNGMFAFVIYDQKNHRLFGARDRMGQKPFYYYHNGKEFEFASQISSIQLHHKQLSISKRSINYYLAWGNVPDPYSIFNEINKLKAGHSFSFNINSGEFKNSQYWDIDHFGKSSFKGTFQNAKEQLNDLLVDSVKNRLYADVPLGIFLSGGIDSSLIAALSTKVSSSTIKTFSVKFDEEGFDESQHAQQVADHLKTNHHVIACTYTEGIDLIENFSYYYDEPFADSSALPSMLLSKHTKKRVTVALSGDGGDESFIGYDRYDWIRRADKIMKYPFLFRKILAPALSSSSVNRYKTISNVLKLKNTNEAYLYAMTGTDSSWFNFNDHLNIDERSYLDHNNKNLFERVSDFDLKTYLNWDINTKVDRASMAYSLEVRAPLQDHRIVEFARSLPTKYKYDKGIMKVVLKEVLYDQVPRHIFDRPKAGFAVPLSAWFRSELKPLVMDELNAHALNTIPGIKNERVVRMIKEHMSGTFNHYFMIWKLLVLKQWLNTNGKYYTIK